MEFADDYYDYNGFGYDGTDKDGCLLLISMADRDWWVSTRGEGITALDSDYFISCLKTDDFMEDLKAGNYDDSFTRFTELVEDFVTEAREDLTDVPDPRDSVFVTETTAPPTTAAPKATTAAPTTTQPPTTAASARIRNDSYRLPLNGTKVSKDYSPTIPVKSKTMDDWRVHNGIDFAAKEGDTVYAVGNGIVKKVTSDERWGYVIEVDHGAFTARYCALQQDGAVSVGKVIAAGDAIGTVAVSPIEQADGCHLHFECLRGGALIDPMEVLDTQG